MEPTLFASFEDAEAGERCVGALLQAGVSPEDISFVAQTGREARHFDVAEGELAAVEAGEAAVPMIGNVRAERFGSDTYEAPVGGGISTSSADDAVSGIEEMDDGQEVAERMIYPDGDSSFSSEEAHDVGEAANTGFFNTTAPDSPSLNGGFLGDEDSPLSHDLDALVVPGLGVVLGGGALATELIGAGNATEIGGRPAASMANYLSDQGIRDEHLAPLMEHWVNGGAILAVAIPVGSADERRIRGALDGENAQNIHMVHR